MVLSTLTVAAVTTPTVVGTGFLHYLNKRNNRGKPAAHIGYNEGLHLVRKFLDYASHRPVEELQAFTQQYVPVPIWVHVEEATIAEAHLSAAAELLVAQLGPDGIEVVGGKQWWRWRLKELKAEWIEMKKDHRARMAHPDRSPRTMLYVHGGAYFFGSVDEHRYQMQRHARKLKARVFAPRYRLAPQFPFPCGLLDIIAAYLHLLTVQPANTIILSGDSAGGGMVTAVLCVLRDQGIPLPAGAILISPWVDLTHSFPSLVEDNSRDYIPAHGFLHRPSITWPPPTEEDMDTAVQQQTAETTGYSNGLTPATDGRSRPRSSSSNREMIVEAMGFQETRVAGVNVNKSAQPHKRTTVVIEGVEIRILDQIQMYTTNDLLNHPLVSPVMQGSLGGLPPILVVTGGGEMLRDEQIFLAHKMANPKKYAPTAEYLAQYPSQAEVLTRFPHGTDCVLQVYDDCCHVTPTLSFTKPAKYMYRAISRFGDWVLNKNITAEEQAYEAEIHKDDAESIISDDSTTSDEELESTENQISGLMHLGRIDKVQDANIPLPPFMAHMIRQRIDRHGNIFPLAPVAELPAMTVSPEAIGVIKPEPVRRWMEGKKKWDTKYAKAKRKVQTQRAKELAEGGYLDFGDDERPPPSALAGRRKPGDLKVPERGNKASWGMRFWSRMGGAQDKETIEKAEEKEEQDQHMHYSSDSDDEAAGTTRDPVDSSGVDTTGAAALTGMGPEASTVTPAVRTPSIADTTRADVITTPGLGPDEFITAPTTPLPTPAAERPQAS